MSTQRPLSPRIVIATSFAVAILVGLFPAAAVASTAWSTPVTVSVDGRNGAGDGMQIAVAPNGDVAGTWAHFDGANYTTQVAVSTDGGSTWGSPATLSDPAGHAEGPNVVINGSGIILVYWVEANGPNWEVQISTSSDRGETWSDQVTISDTSYSTNAPNIIANGEHGFIAAFDMNDGGGDDVMTRTSNNDGASWSSFELASGGTVASFTPELSINEVGTIELVWFQNGTGTWDIFSASSSDGGLSWTSPVEVISGENVDSEIVLAPTSDNSFILLWSTADGLSSGVFGQKSSTDGNSWNAPFEIAGGTLERSYFTGASAHGIIATAWVDDDGTTSSILVSLSQDAGLTWSSPQTVATTPNTLSTSYWYIDVEVGSTHNVALTWSKIGGDLSGDDDSTQVITTGDLGVTWSPVAEPGGLSTGFAHVATLASGHFVIAWVLMGDGESAVQSATSITPSLPDTGLDMQLGLITALLAGVAGALGLAMKRWGRLRESNSRPIHYE